MACESRAQQEETNTNMSQTIPSFPEEKELSALDAVVVMKLRGRLAAAGTRHRTKRKEK